MAEGDTDVSICSQALLLLGANQITSFSDGTSPSSICSVLYPRVKSQTLGMYPWSFTLAKKTLAQLAETPTNYWTYAYQLPNDMFLGVPRTVYASTSGSAPKITEYEIQGNQMLTNETTIVVDYQKFVSETDMPSYFIQMLVYQMAWHLAEPVTDQLTKSDYWKTIALGTATENMRGGYFRQAINIDGGGQSKTVIADYLLTEARF
tara:strand:- start:6169 stop:6786 length:618 start_codon:yes stop_codon:yes gene_type:complete